MRVADPTQKESAKGRFETKVRCFAFAATSVALTLLAEFGSPKQSTMRRYKSEKLIDIGDLLDLTGGLLLRCCFICHCPVSVGLIIADTFLALGEAKEEQASGQPGGPGSALFHSQSHDK